MHSSVVFLETMASLSMRLDGRCGQAWEINLKITTYMCKTLANVRIDSPSSCHPVLYHLFLFLVGPVYIKHIL